MQLIKTLVLPYLFYPPVPLHLASDNQMRKLQRVQNNALRFAHNTQWDDFISNKDLNTKFVPGLRPVNQELFWRAKKTWTSIKERNAGDPKMLEDILALQRDLSSRRAVALHKYPSSFHQAMNKPEPAPFYG